MNLLLIESLDDYDREGLNLELRKHGLILRPPTQDEWEDGTDSAGNEQDMGWDDSEEGYDYYVLTGVKDDAAD